MKIRKDVILNRLNKMASKGVSEQKLVKFLARWKVRARKQGLRLKIYFHTSTAIATESI